MHVVKPAHHTLTPIAIMAMALLREDDMHPYEMIRLLRHRRDDRMVAITNGTFYHTIARLQRAGFIDEVGSDRDGNRPERTTYTLLPAGAEAVRAWLRAELPRVDRPVEFRVALAEAHNLERSEVIDLLRQRAAQLDADYAEHRLGLAEARAGGVPEQYLIEVERQEALLTAETRWLHQTIDRLADPGYAWGGDPKPHETVYRAQREAARS
ncbi:MAG: transcriptional regulator [Microbacterium sp. 67-17]|uniref:PadR family transcriptional regulator n=1 Tax=Microbacterium sp. 67-17 TaxID=1895782 RepID=UPI000967FFFB|nr:PadR family transcriptional regulator [Microbacterium sp. 67-17]OJV93483.1 MAG: transcriptional regulator [Microbacterium sp. 67-17]